MVPTHHPIIVENSSHRLDRTLWYYLYSNQIKYNPIPRKKYSSNLSREVKNWSWNSTKVKEAFFSYSNLQYLKWSTKELQRWLSTNRRIFQRYKLSLKNKESTKAPSIYSTLFDPNTNIPPKSLQQYITYIEFLERNI